MDAGAGTSISLTIAALALSVGIVTALWSGYWFGPRGDDTEDYHWLALNVVQGHGLSLSETAPYQLSAKRAPVFPLFLAIVYRFFGESWTALLVVQAVVLGVSWILLADTSAAVFGKRVAVVTVFAAALNPYLGRTAGSVLTEALFTALAVAMIWALVRGLVSARLAWFLAAGVLWGLATLCRSATVIALPLLCVSVWLWAPFPPGGLRRGRATAVLLATAILTMLPWTVRNYVEFRQFIPLQTGAFGSNFWLTTLDAEDQPTTNWDGKADQWRRKYPEAAQWASATTSVELQAAERMLVSAGIRRIRKDPWRYIENHGRAIPHLWLHSGKLWFTDTSFGDAIASRRYGIVLVKAVTFLGLSLAPLTLAGAGIWLGRSQWRQLTPLLIMPAAIAAAYMPSWIEERYGLPAVPFFLILASFAAVALYDRLRSPRMEPARA